MRPKSTWFKGLLSRKASPARSFPTSGFPTIGHEVKVEEENWEWYSEKEFYPLRIGATLQSRYQILGKLGYGAHSTAWLCRDLDAHSYVTLKVCERDSKSALRELAVYKRIDACPGSHPGSSLIRRLLGNFELAGLGGQHVCLIHEPLGMSIATFRDLMPDRRLSEEFLKAIVKHLLRALDFLHTEAKVVHTDIHAMNLALRVEDDSILKQFETNELARPSARKIDGERVIYESRGLMMPRDHGKPLLCDFGEARYGQPSYTDDAQPYEFRAPEVILDIPWTEKIDIWNVGVLTWDLLENKLLFNARAPDGEQSSEQHLAEMTGVLGPPPLDYLHRSETSWTYFDAQGLWKSPTQIPEGSLEDLEQHLEGESKRLFLGFMRQTLQWRPESRPTAQLLLQEPWLQC